MKNIKSLVAILLSILMIFACFTGCADKETSSEPDKDVETSSVESEEEEYSETITIAMASYGEEGEAWNTDGEYGEAFRTMLTEVEQEFKVNIEVDYYSATEFRSIAQTSITNGDTEFADLMIMHMHAFGPLQAQGLFYDLSTIKDFNVKSDLWNDKITNVATFKNGIYGTGNSDLLLHSGVIVHYNKDMVKSLGLEDPVALVKRGEWTWDKFRQYCLKAAKDMNNDGAFTDADRFGCTSQSYDGLIPAFLTSGVEVIKKDASGNLVYNLMSNEAVTALQKFKATFTVSDGMLFDAYMDAGAQQNQFLSGKTMFILGGVNLSAYEIGEDFEVGMIPYPKYNASSDYISHNYHNERLFAIPAISERAELTAKVLTRMAEKSKGFFKLQIEDSSVQYVDREAYIDMATNYISGKFSIDRFTTIINANESIAMGTMRAISMPIFTASTYVDYTTPYAGPIQNLLNEMFNN